MRFLQELEVMCEGNHRLAYNKELMKTETRAVKMLRSWVVETKWWRPLALLLRSWNLYDEVKQGWIFEYYLYQQWCRAVFPKPIWWWVTDTLLLSCNNMLWYVYLFFPIKKRRLQTNSIHFWKHYYARAHLTPSLSHCYPEWFKEVPEIKRMSLRPKVSMAIPVNGGMSVSVTISPSSMVVSVVIWSLCGNIGAVWHGVMPSVDVRVLLGISSAGSMSSCFMISSASIAWPGESEPGVAEYKWQERSVQFGHILQRFSQKQLWRFPV